MLTEINDNAISIPWYYNISDKVKASLVWIYIFVLVILLFELVLEIITFDKFDFIMLFILNGYHYSIKKYILMLLVKLLVIREYFITVIAF